jgi:hypothetical protein
MGRKLITAQEAKEKANAYYSLQRICEQIRKNAEEGRTLIRIRSISLENKVKLEELGYIVTVDILNCVFPVSISWK